MSNQQFAGLDRFKNKYRSRYCNADGLPEIPELQPGQNVMSAINDYFQDADCDLEESSQVSWSTPVNEISSKLIKHPQSNRRSASSPFLIGSKKDPSFQIAQAPNISNSINLLLSTERLQHCKAVKDAFPNPGNTTNRKSVLIHGSSKANPNFLSSSEEEEQSYGGLVNSKAALAKSLLLQPVYSSPKSSTHQRLSFRDRLSLKRSEADVNRMTNMTKKEAIKSVEDKCPQTQASNHFSETDKLLFSPLVKSSPAKTATCWHSAVAIETPVPAATPLQQAEEEEFVMAEVANLNVKSWSSSSKNTKPRSTGSMLKPVEKSQPDAKRASNLGERVVSTCEDSSSEEQYALSEASSKVSAQRMKSKSKAIQKKKQPETESPPNDDPFPGLISVNLLSLSPEHDNEPNEEVQDHKQQYSEKEVNLRNLSDANRHTISSPYKCYMLMKEVARKATLQKNSTKAVSHSPAVQNALPGLSLSVRKAGIGDVLLHESVKNATFLASSGEEEGNADLVNDEALLFGEEKESADKIMEKPRERTYTIDTSAVQEPASPTIKLTTKKRLSFKDSPLLRKTAVIVNKLGEMSEKDELLDSFEKKNRSKDLDNLMDLDKNHTTSHFQKNTASEHTDSRIRSVQSTATIDGEIVNKNKKTEMGSRVSKSTIQLKKQNPIVQAKRPLSSMFLQAARFPTVAPAAAPVIAPASPQQAEDEEFIIDEADSFILKSWISIPKKDKPPAKGPLPKTVVKLQAGNKRKVNKEAGSTSRVSRSDDEMLENNNAVLARADQTDPQASSPEEVNAIKPSFKDSSLSKVPPLEQMLTGKDSSDLKPKKNKTGRPRKYPLEHCDVINKNAGKSVKKSVSKKRVSQRIKNTGEANEKQGKQNTNFIKTQILQLSPRHENCEPNTVHLPDLSGEVNVSAKAQKSKISPQKRRQSKKETALKRSLPPDASKRPNSQNSQGISSPEPQNMSGAEEQYAEEELNQTPASLNKKQKRTKGGKRKISANVDIQEIKEGAVDTGEPSFTLQSIEVKDNAAHASEHRVSGYSQRTHKQPSCWWMVSPTPVNTTISLEKKSPRKPTPKEKTKNKKQVKSRIKQQQKQKKTRKNVNLSELPQSQAKDVVTNDDPADEAQTEVIQNEEPSPVKRTARRRRQIESDDSSKEEPVVPILSPGKPAKKRKFPEDKDDKNSKVNPVPPKMPISILKKVSQKTRNVVFEEGEEHSTEEREADQSTDDVFLSPQNPVSRMSELRKSLMPSTHDENIPKFRKSLASFGAAYNKTPTVPKMAPKNLSGSGTKSRTSPYNSPRHTIRSPCSNVNSDSAIRSEHPEVVQDTNSEGEEPALSSQSLINQKKSLETCETPSGSSSSSAGSNYSGTGMHFNKSGSCLRSGSGPAVSRFVRFTCADERPVAYEAYESSSTSDDEPIEDDNQTCYNRGKIVLPTNTPNVRRSKRTKVKPLQYWRGERVEYKTRPSGGVLIEGVLAPTNEEPYSKAVAKRKNARKKQDEFHPNEQNPVLLDHTVVLDPSTGTEILFECITRADECEFHQSSELISVCKGINNPIFSMGKLIIGPLQEKGYQSVCLDTILFYIIRGTVEVTIYLTSYILKTGDQFCIPPGNMYNIKNLQTKDAVFHFTQIKGRRLTLEASN
ncbi:centromere protein C [Discoglossus pictus]